MTTSAPRSACSGGFSAGSMGAPQVPLGPETTCSCPSCSENAMNSLKHKDPPLPKAKDLPQTNAVPCAMPVLTSWTGNCVVGKQMPPHQSAKAWVPGGALALGDGMPLKTKSTLCAAEAMPGDSAASVRTDEARSAGRSFM